MQKNEKTVEVESVETSEEVIETITIEDLKTVVGGRRPIARSNINLVENLNHD